MIEPRPDDPPPDWLAAYADGELTARERARIEDWLANCSDACEMLDAQESLGPGNAGLWQSVEPPAPTLADWSRVRLAIHSHCRARPRRNRIPAIGTVGLLATAASLFIVLSMPEQGVVEHSASAKSPAEELIVEQPYAMASNDEVQIISLPESSARLLVVGEHPLHQSTLSLAGFGDVEFYGVGSDLAGRFPELPTDPSTEEIPMIWAPRAP